jgi:hypothetical protein
MNESHSDFLLLWSDAIEADSVVMTVDESGTVYLFQTGIFITSWPLATYVPDERNEQ